MEGGAFIDALVVGTLSTSTRELVAMIVLRLRFPGPETASKTS